MISQDNIQVNNILDSVEELKTKYDADGVKVYFKSKVGFSIKLIKDDKVIKKFRKGNHCNEQFESKRGDDQ